MLSFLSPCNHAEADTRVFLHVNDMSLQGRTKITIRTVDTNVLVIAVSVFARLQVQLEELWIDFGTGKHRQFVPIPVIVSNLGCSKSLGIPFCQPTFHDIKESIPMVERFTVLTLIKV